MTDVYHKSFIAEDVCIAAFQFDVPNAPIEVRAKGRSATRNALPGTTNTVRTKRPAECLRAATAITLQWHANVSEPITFAHWLDRCSPPSPLSSVTVTCERSRQRPAPFTLPLRFCPLPIVRA